MFSRLRNLSTSPYQSAVLKPIPTSSSLNRPSRLYSFESGRKRKPDGTDESDPDQITSPESADSKPLASTSSVPETGRGRRGGHRPSQSHSTASLHSPAKLALPFEPLSSDRLAHLRPKTLSLDMFFSVQRPLLEIELSSSERRSINSESKQPRPDLETDPAAFEDHVEQLNSRINTGSPSDPAFKPPQPSSTRLSLLENDLDEESWSSTDAYQPYLITEPEGVNPAWSSAVKHYLACAQPLVPPRPPRPREDEEVQALLTAEAEARAGVDESKLPLAEEDYQIELSRQRALEYLTPYGTVSVKENTPPTTSISQDINATEQRETTSTNNSLPQIPQDPLSLTMQAARYLHSGMMSVRWPTATNWVMIKSQLAEAEQTFLQVRQEGETTAAKSIPPVRGQEQPCTAGRRQRSTSLRMQLKLGNKSTPHIVTLSEKQLAQIIKYSEKILREKIGLDNVPKAIVMSLGRLGEFLIHKHNQRSSGTAMSVVKQTAIVELDSVFRKKKRKMKVHKYKKRRKARRTLRKRQGRD